MAQIPLRTLCSKHYHEKEQTDDSKVIKPRIKTVEAEHAADWKGFRAQLIKNDLVRGTIYVNSECTSVGLIQDMLSAYKTYFIGIDNLMHLAKHNAAKLVQYITPEVLGTLKIATICHRPRRDDVAGSPSSSGPAIRRRNRASMAVSATDVQALATLEKAFIDAEPDPEDRYLLLGLWRALFSCPDIAVKMRLVACGLFKIITAMLAYTEDPELIIHFLEGLKYFFVLPDTPLAVTKKKKSGRSLLDRLVEITGTPVTSPAQGQVVMRIMDLFYYLDDPSSATAMVDAGLIAALTKLSVDGSAFLALRSKALELFRIFPASSRRAILASGVMANFSELLASPSNRSTHHSFLSRVLGFLSFLAAEDIANISSDKILQNLVMLVSFKQATEQNKIEALKIITLAMGKYSQPILDANLPFALASLLLDPQTSQMLRDPILAFFSQSAFEEPATFNRLLDGGVIRLMFELLASSTSEADSVVARKFLLNTALTKEKLVDGGLISAVQLLLDYRRLAVRSRSADSSFIKDNAEVIFQLALSLGRIPDIQKSLIPSLLRDLLKYSPVGTPIMEKVRKADNEAKFFPDCAPAPSDPSITDFDPALGLLVPIELIEHYLGLIPILDDETVFNADLHNYLFVIAMAQPNDSLTQFAWSMLNNRVGWIEKLDKVLLFETFQTFAQDNLANAKRTVNMLQDMEPGFGHVDYVLHNIAKLASTTTLFGLLTSQLSKFEAYLEIINHPTFLDVFLVAPADIRAPILYDIVKSEMKKTPSLMARLREPSAVFSLLSNLMESVTTLRDKPIAVVAESAKAVRDFSYEFLSSSQHLEDIIGSRGVSYLLQLIAEPATGLSLLKWALGFLEITLPKIQRAEVTELNVYMTLWNVVDTCDLSRELSDGSFTSFPTEVSLAAWKILCKQPDYLTWLNSLPNFTKTVTTWFFSAQSQFQLMALSIMEPTRWARAGCATAESFAAWRLKLNRGRLAFCSAQKDINLSEVTKLARSFANNRVIDDNLSWIADKSSMSSALSDFLAIDLQLRPADQSEQTKEFTTLTEYLKFLRVCKHEQVKQRFIPLLDTFHDSLFFLPDAVPSDGDWVKYYALDASQAEKNANETRLKQSLARSATSTLASKAESKALGAKSKVLSSVISKSGTSVLSASASSAPGKWRSNVPAQYQLLRAWQFNSLANSAKFFGVATALNNHFFELCWDSIQQGFDIPAMRHRCSGLDRILIVAHVSMPKTGYLSHTDAHFAFYVPGQLRYTVTPNVWTPSKVVLAAFQDMDDPTKTTSVDVTPDSNNSGYAIEHLKGIISLIEDASKTYPDVVINMGAKTLSFPNHSRSVWTRKVWNDSSITTDLKIVHMQAFRLAANKTLGRLTVMTRRGFTADADAAADNDDEAAADTSIQEVAESIGETLSKKVAFSEPEKTVKKAEAEKSDPSDAMDLSGMDADSFMNRHLAKTLNAALDSHLDSVRTARPILTSLAPPGGPKPTWIRAFRQSYATDNSLLSFIGRAQINMFTQIAKAGGEGKPVFGIIKMKWSANPDEPKSPYTSATAPVFGFYIHAGFTATNIGGYTRDNFAMIFSLRGPNQRPPVFFPINLHDSTNAFRLINDHAIQFGTGTDLMLDFADPSNCFSNLGMTYGLPDDVYFMSKEARELITDRLPLSWDFEEVELYFKTASKASISMPTPTLGHLLRLLGQKDVLLLNQIRWRLKYLMVSATTENKRQILEEIRRAQSADMTAQVLEPENNLTKRIEHPGVDTISLRPVAINGRPLSAEETAQLEHVIFHPTSASFVGDATASPFDVTFAVLPSSTSDAASLSNEQLANAPINSLPYLTHVILAARMEGTKSNQRARAAVIFASDTMIPPQVLSAVFPEARTYVDDYQKVITVNAKDHLRWYEHNAPSALDPSRNFHIGPLLRPAEIKLASADTGLVSNSEDDFWSFLTPADDEAKVEAKPLALPSHQTFVEDYQLDRLRVDTDPVGLVKLDDAKEVGTATLSAAVRARYVTIRFLPGNSNKPVYFSTLKFLGYHPENNHFLVPPKPEAISDVLPIYTANLVTPSQNHVISYDGDDSVGIIGKLRNDVHKNEVAAFQKEFMLRFSNHLFDQQNMKSEQFYMAKNPSLFFWGGTAPCWFMWRFTNLTVCPTAFMLRHGYNKNNSFIQNFVFQGTNDEPGPGMVWTDIENYPSHYHSFSGEAKVFELVTPPKEFYSTFRVLQRGDYFMGVSVKGSPFMCVSEFEVYGEMRYNAGAEPQKISTKAFTAADVDAALGFNTTYDAPISRLLSHV